MNVAPPLPPAAPPPDGEVPTVLPSGRPPVAPEDARPAKALTPEAPVALPSPALAAPPPLPPSPCAACGAPMTPGWAHCPVCGHQRETGRLTIRSLFGDLVSRTVALERGFTRAFVGLSVAPGRTVRDFVEGARRTTPPLGYLFVSAAFALLLFSLQADQARDELREITVQSARDNPGFQDMVSSEIIDRYVDVNLAVLEATYPYQLILLVIPTTLLMRLFFRRRYNLAEIGVFVIYTTSHTGMIGAALAYALGPWLGLFNASYLVLALAVPYNGVAAAGFFQVGLVRAMLLSFVATAVAFFAFSVALDSAVMAYVLLT